jgi:hypothetical protein
VRSARREGWLGPSRVQCERIPRVGSNRSAQRSPKIVAALGCPTTFHFILSLSFIHRCGGRFDSFAYIDSDPSPVSLGPNDWVISFNSLSRRASRAWGGGNGCEKGAKPLSRCNTLLMAQPPSVHFTSLAELLMHVVQWGDSPRGGRMVVHLFSSPTPQAKVSPGWALTMFIFQPTDRHASTLGVKTCHYLWPEL